MILGLFDDPACHLALRVNLNKSSAGGLFGAGPGWITCTEALGFLGRGCGVRHVQ